jgi:hypothetical protein
MLPNHLTSRTALVFWLRIASLRSSFQRPSSLWLWEGCLPCCPAGPEVSLKDLDDMSSMTGDVALGRCWGWAGGCAIMMPSVVSWKTAVVCLGLPGGLVSGVEPSVSGVGPRAAKRERGRRS